MASLDAPPIEDQQKAEAARRLAAALMQPIPLSQTAGRIDAPWRPDQIAPPPQYLTSMANNPIAHGIGEAVLSPITDAGEYIGGLMQGTIPFQSGEAAVEGLKLGSAFVGPKVGTGAMTAGAKLAPLLGMFAGPMAETADRAALRLAQQMAEKGMARQQIWDATGWFTGPPEMVGARNLPPPCRRGRGPQRSASASHDAGNATVHPAMDH